ncbi:hypothetical protein NLM24_04860 [Nocardia zapadnayensis]|nr:hypothetical protein [Nocardia zapadnayensis]MCX0270050.1 hypothetical protein [Nocardia zapadnayensis]
MQNAVLAAANGAPPPIAGTTVTSAGWFAAVRVLAAMLRFSGAPVTLPRNGTGDDVAQNLLVSFTNQYRQRKADGAINPGDLRAMPATPELTAGLLAAVGAILCLPHDRAACHVAIAELAEAFDRMRRRQRGHNPLQSVSIPEPLANILSAFSFPSSRVAGAAPAPTRRSPLEPAHLPQLLDDCDYRELLQRYLPGTAPVTGRRLAAMALARRIGARSWPDAAGLLDLDPQRAARTADVVVRRIKDVAGFWAATDQALARLERRPRVDYADRRRRLAHLLEVPHPQLRAAGRGRHFPVTSARRRHAAAWVWAQLTGGDVRDAPAYHQQWNIDNESQREGARRFANRLPVAVADTLTTWATQELLEENHT